MHGFPRRSRGRRTTGRNSHDPAASRRAARRRSSAPARSSVGATFDRRPTASTVDRAYADVQLDRRRLRRLAPGAREQSGTEPDHARPASSSRAALAVLEGYLPTPTIGVSRNPNGRPTAHRRAVFTVEPRANATLQVPISATAVGRAYRSTTLRTPARTTLGGRHQGSPTELGPRHSRRTATDPRQRSATALRDIIGRSRRRRSTSSASASTVTARRSATVSDITGRRR